MVRGMVTFRSRGSPFLTSLTAANASQRERALALFKTRMRKHEERFAATTREPLPLFGSLAFL